ncbi:U6 snRNA phosphodiesterase Usb1 [Epithele typhae]|uniref:U6 snRNA phosphodiesterase Usb1 n=1 Tax=Epithele typhae TaxID=378194 RepID=UPI0020089C03|nr:U6 snRNA phosphodiesterase Usb1 [Epithele typhae]KAH9914182.1 U6 snRNA phosphodiesterase Usb1 [Epithele typhae]
MKRTVSLVDYASSDSEQDEPTTQPPPAKGSSPPPTKKPRKLPALSAALLPQVPVDNPALHQGRKRTAAHVEGQWAAHVYVPLVVNRRSKLFKLLVRIYSSAKQLVPSLHPIGLTDADLSPPSSAGPEPPDNTIELHISLTRPTYLRAHQRDEFKRAVHALARTRASFPASFAAVSELTNDERTRTFLALELGAGHDELRGLSDGLKPTLQSLRQHEFYEKPRFHASIAWALLDGSSPPGDGQCSEDVDAQNCDFVTIPSFPPSLVPQLQREFCGELVKPGVGTFEADELHVRIGKEVTKWKLQ